MLQRRGALSRSGARRFEGLGKLFELLLALDGDLEAARGHPGEEPGQMLGGEAHPLCHLRIGRRAAPALCPRPRPARLALGSSNREPLPDDLACEAAPAVGVGHSQDCTGMALGQLAPLDHGKHVI